MQHGKLTRLRALPEAWVRAKSIPGPQHWKTPHEAMISPRRAAIWQELANGLEDSGELRAGGSRATNPAPAGPDPAAASSDWLARFRGLLQEGDVEAKELWESRQEEIAARLPFHVIQRISLALNDFEFDTALGLLPANSEGQRQAPDSAARK